MGDFIRCIFLLSQAFEELCACRRFSSKNLFACSVTNDKNGKDAEQKENPAGCAWENEHEVMGHDVDRQNVDKKAKKK